MSDNSDAKNEVERRLELVSGGLEKAAVELQKLVDNMKIALQEAKVQSTGPQGKTGPKGDTGPIGPEGPQGKKGEPGDDAA